LSAINQINIGLLGCGTVGTGVVRLLLENAKLIHDRVGALICLKKIADINLVPIKKLFIDGKPINAELMTQHAEEVVSDPDIHIIVETIGGETVAKDLILSAIEKGKHIVTANKALLSSHGNTIIEKANQRGVDLAYEASVGGCMPIIKTIRETLVSNHIHYVIGILNGTCNYILSKITNDHLSFQDALAEAQQMGYAEADPTLDVEGIDTAHKLSILMALAFGMPITFDPIYIEGISKLSALDIQLAEQFGYRIKLLAIAKKNGNAIEARVHPTMIPFHNLLSNVNGSLNAMMISGDAVGEMILYGYGAGMMPTASAILSDIVDIARNILSGSKGRIPILSYQNQAIKTINVLPIEAIESKYYFRFTASDKPGVLHQISGILAKYQISIESVHQKGKDSDDVPIVMMTYKAKEKDVRQALKEIQDLNVVTETPILIRVE